MTDKQMEEKKKEFEDLISVELQGWYQLGLHDGFKIDDDMLLSHKEMVEGVIKKQPSTEIWDFIEKLVEEVERECNKGKLRIERGRSSREYRLVCAMCNGDKSEFCRFCEGMGSHMITFN